MSGFPNGIPYKAGVRDCQTVPPTSPPAPPECAVETQPKSCSTVGQSSQAIRLGQPAKFQVAVTGSPLIRFQWSRNGVEIAGATEPSYTTPPTTADDNDSVYSVTATNPVGSVKSASRQSHRANTGKPT